MLSVPVPATAQTVGPFTEQVAPNFELADSTGRTVSLAELRRTSSTVVLHFWGVTRGVCVLELPAVLRFHDDAALQGVAFATIVSGDVVPTRTKVVEPPGTVLLAGPRPLTG